MVPAALALEVEEPVAGGGLTLFQPPRWAAAAGRYLLLSAGELP